MNASALIVASEFNLGNPGEVRGSSEIPSRGASGGSAIPGILMSCNRSKLANCFLPASLFSL